MSNDNYYPIGRDSRVWVAKRDTSPETATFDILGKGGCHDITREQAEGLIAGLTAIFPPLPEPEPVVVEDIDLNPPTDGPETRSFELDGVEYVATNWYDTMGWEIRPRRAVYTMGGGAPALRLGWVGNVAGDVRVQLGDTKVILGQRTKRFDEGVRLLVQHVK